MMRRVLPALVLVVFVAGFGVSAVGALRGPGVPSGLAAVQPVLQFGSRGDVVAAWQRMLDEWLATTGPADHWVRIARARVGSRLSADGVFGDATRAATRLWQRDAYLPATGVVSLRTWMTWIGGNVTCCGAGLPNFTAAVLGRNPDAYVGWWQLAVDRWSSQHQRRLIPITGIYNARTESATELFQRDVGLRATGIAGRATWRLAQRRGLLTL